MKQNFVCKQCGKSYTSYKQRSDFCSMDCKRAWRNSLTYNCDYCEKSFVVTPHQLRDLENGVHKHLFCSADCANAYKANKVEKICEYCGNSYSTYNCWKDTARFCSKRCFYEYKNKHKKIYHKICPQCNKSYVTTREDQICCSVDCRGKLDRKRHTLVCETCGKQFERINSEVSKTQRHYCSIECKRAGMFWNEEDTNILIQNYNKLPLKDIVNLVSDKWDYDAVRRRAGYLGLTESREWTDQEVSVLLNYYETMPVNCLMKMLPNRTYISILHKARFYGLKSFFYTSQLYTEEDIKYLKNNYLTQTNDELASALNRTSSAIAQRLALLGLQRPKEVGNYKDLIEYTRSHIKVWANQCREKFNYTCALSGSHSNLVIHHIYGFNLLFEEVVQALDFPVYESFNMYSIEELDEFVNTFLILQEVYGEYICITQDIHKLFHKIYGYGDNTREQWDEFVSTHSF